MIGGTILSLYDWYADMPIAAPLVFGDQTDVPESGDWFNSTYLIIWSTNLSITRTPDAHFMTEARYRGQKVVIVSPDYSDHTKFADNWLPAAPGTGGALAMATGHVILSEFFRDRQVPYFTDYVKTYTDAPFLVTLENATTRSCLAGSWPPQTSATLRTVPLTNGHAKREDRGTRGPERLTGLPVLRNRPGPLEPRPGRGGLGPYPLRAAHRGGRWTAAIGIPETAYRWFSASAGTLAAVLIIAGVVILARRRLLVARVRATTSAVDYVALIPAAVHHPDRDHPTLFVNLLGHGYDYRTTVAPWFGGLFTDSPCDRDRERTGLLPDARRFRVADLGGVALQRLVHAWSGPLGTCGGSTSSTAAARRR